MGFKDFLKLEDYSGGDEKCPESWNNYIVSKNKFFRYLCSESDIDWGECSGLLEVWKSGITDYITFDDKKSENQKAEEIEIFFSQWNHAAKLFICARFVAEKKNEFRTFESHDGKTDIYLFQIFKEFAMQFPEFSPEKLNLGLNEFVILSAIFHAKELPTEIREIPFSTVDRDEKEGAIHLLELRRVIGYGRALENPSRFPHVDVYAKRIEPSFRNAIQHALTLNMNSMQWEEEIKQLEKEIDELEKSDKFGVSNTLKHARKRLEDRKKLGNIEIVNVNRLGIIWDVKPFFSAKQLEEIEENKKKVPVANQKDENPDQITKPKAQTVLDGIDGPSVGIAAKEGIYHTLRNNFPDNRLIYSAKLEVENNKPNGKISGIRGIPQKIQAAIDSDFIDTFAAHKSNIGSDFDKKFKLVNDKRVDTFRIFSLNDDGGFEGEPIVLKQEKPKE